MYKNQLEIKGILDNSKSASYLDHQLYLGNKESLNKKLFVQCDDLKFPIVKFPFNDSNIPAATACGVYISQLIRLQEGVPIQ